jgi:hypothetical protein
MLVPVLALLLLPPLARAGDHPVAGDRLSLVDPGDPARRSVRFQAVRDPAIVLEEDPRSTGATLEIEGAGPGDGDSGPVALAAGLWTGLGNPPGSKGYKYRDPARQQGVRTVVLKRGNARGTITVSGGGAMWPYAVTQPQGPVDVRLTVGADAFCTTFAGDDFVRNEPGRVVARGAEAPACCGSPVCGNGTAECEEECDDGDTDGGDGCSSTCQLENTSAVCAGVPTVAGTAIASVRVASGLTAPVHLAAPRLDPNRVFVVEQPGRIRVIRDGVLLGPAFLDITGLVTYGGEQGLLALAFHPDYETNGRFFVYYNDAAGDVVIARYAVSGDPDDADEGSAHIMLTIPHPTFGNHNGGGFAFGPDGFLYAGTGDGGGGGDPFENAQNDASRLGKLLRIDPATDAVTNWAKGLRNPFRLSFDRATGDLYVGDVGQNRWEEVDYAPGNPAGVNYGWDDMEGRHCFEPPSGCLTGGRTLPVLEYCNASFSDPACDTFQPEKGESVIGGAVYRGCRMPDLHGRYFYADFYTAFIRSFMGVSGGNAQSIQNHTAALDPPGAPAINNPSSIAEDARGELYVTDYDGEVFRIVPGS